MDNRVFKIGICLIIALRVSGCTTTHEGDPVIGSWIYSYKDSQGDRKITYTFNFMGRYDATNFDYSYQYGPHSLGPSFGSWKQADNDEYIVIDEAGFAGGTILPSFDKQVSLLLNKKSTNTTSYLQFSWFGRELPFMCVSTIPTFSSTTIR